MTKSISASYLKSLAHRFTGELYRQEKDMLEKFKIHREGPDFDIFHYKFKDPDMIGMLELAVIRKMPHPHFHSSEGVAWFFFLDDNGAMSLGGAEDEKSCILTKIKAEKGIFYPIAPGMIHAAGPWNTERKTQLLIFNPSGLRVRPENTNYTADSRERAVGKEYTPVKF